MVAYKAGQTERFVAAPDERFAAMLLYGPDSGLVADRGDRLARKFSERDDPEIVRIGDSELADDPDRLAVEVRTRPMFASGKIVRLRAGTRTDAKALAMLLDDPLEAVLIVEAGALRPTSPIRKAFEKADRAVALPCYSDGPGDLRAVIDAETAAAGIRLSKDAHAHLSARLGSDPLLARAELVKLMTYAQDADEISIEDIDAVVGDGSDAALDLFANAVGAKNLARALTQIARLAQAGQSLQGALAILSNHFRRLHAIAAQAETGAPINTVLSRMKPPVHFKQRDALAAQARQWSSKAAGEALRRIQDTTRRARLTPDLEQALIEQLLIRLCRARPRAR